MRNIEVGDQVEVIRTFWSGFRGTVQSVSDDDGWGGRSARVQLNYPLSSVIAIKIGDLRSINPLDRLAEL